MSGSFDLDDPEAQQDDRPDPQASAEYAFSTLVGVDGTVEVEWVTEAFARDFDIEGNPGGLGILSLVHEDDLPVARRGLEQLAGGREFVAELRMITGDGTARWVHFYALPITRGGKVVRVLGGMLDIGERKAAEDRIRTGIELLKKTEEERARLLARLIAARENGPVERATDPGDDPMRAVAFVGGRLELLTREFEDPRRTEALRLVDEVVGRAVEQLRELMSELRPPELDMEGLASAIWNSMEHARTETRMKYRLENRLRNEPGQRTRLAVYRILQDALANVRQHSRAEHAEVLVENRDGGIFVRVWDDGLGFSKHEVDLPRSGQLGLTSMRDRAESAGGWLKIDTLPALGTRVEFWVPDSNSRAQSG